MKNLALFAMFTTLAACFASPAHAQVTLGQIDDFGDGTVQSWLNGGGIGAIATANIDGELQLATNGNTGGAGHNLIAFNLNQWAGDYLAAGVGGLLLDIDNSDNAADVNIRIGLQGPGGGFATEDVVVPAGGSVDGAFFDLTPDSLLFLSGLNDPDATLAGVSELRIVHNPIAGVAANGALIGEAVGSPPFAATVRFDNLTAVAAIPEPAAAGMALLAAVSVAARRRIEQPMQS